MTARLHITIRRDAPGTHMLAVTRTTPPMALAAQRATRAECELLAARVVDAVQIGGPGADVIAMVHAAERAAHGA